jgi:hypothetical protein
MVNANPKYQLPPGYIRVKVDKIQEVYEPDPKLYPKESQKISIQIIDDLIDNLFGFHVIEPLIINEKRWAVKQESLISTFKKPKEPRYL